MQSCSASVTLKHWLTEAHLRYPISNTLGKWPALHAEHLAAERMELQESLSHCLWSPKVFSLKFTEIFLSKDGALRLLLCCLLWRLIFGLPASVLSKNLQTIKKEKPTVIVIQTKPQNSDFQAHLQHPCCSTSTLLYPGMPPNRSEGQSPMLTEAGHWDNSKYQLSIWSQIWKLLSGKCHRDRNTDFDSDLSETMIRFYPVSPRDNLKTQQVGVIPSAFPNTPSPPFTVSSLRNTGPNPLVCLCKLTADIS